MKKLLPSAIAVALLAIGYIGAAHTAIPFLPPPPVKPFTPAAVSTASATGGPLNLTIHFANGKTVNVTRQWNSFVFMNDPSHTLSIDLSTDTVFCGCFDQ